MQYWNGKPKTMQETPTRYKHVDGLEDLFNRTGPARKLRLGQEFLLCIMRLRLCFYYVPNIAFRFGISEIQNFHNLD